MSLRDAALAALNSRREAREQEEAERNRQTEIAAIDRIKKSPLGEWFPDVVWQCVGNLTNGVTLVRELGSVAVFLGARISEDSSDEWEIAIYRPSLLGGILGPAQYEKVEVVNEAADIGAYIERTEPRVTPS